MSLFAEANQTYTKYFGTSPPSRATISIPLPRDIGVKLEVLGFDDSEVSSRGGNGQALDEGEVGGTEDQGTGVRLGNRSALHVQGLSYWAPANIGPYSQAVVVSHPCTASYASLRLFNALESRRETMMLVIIQESFQVVFPRC